MSFQDFGKKSAGRPQNRNGNNSAISGGISLGAQRQGGPTGTGRDDYASVSQAILQYQQNVGILSKIVGTIGTNDDGPLTQQQFKVQLDVIRQLGQNIESLLGEQEQKMETLSRTDASKSRSTHIKLTRDYRWVETKFKNLQLEARQSWNSLEMRRAAELEDSNRRQFEQGINADNKRLQMKLQDDRVTEEIMREREEEVRKINQGMHQVNEIYKVSRGLESVYPCNRTAISQPAVVIIL